MRNLPIPYKHSLDSRNAPERRSRDFKRELSPEPVEEERLDTSNLDIPLMNNTEETLNRQDPMMVTHYSVESRDSDTQTDRREIKLDQNLFVDMSSEKKFLTDREKSTMELNNSIMVKNIEQDTRKLRDLVSMTPTG